jgi:excisionase family DNA binding protein
VSDRPTVTAPIPTADRLLTAADVASLLGVQPATVCRWVELGKLSAFRLGGVKGARLRIRESALEAFLTGTTGTPLRPSSSPDVSDEVDEADEVDDDEADDADGVNSTGDGGDR